MRNKFIFVGIASVVLTAIVVFFALSAPREEESITFNRIGNLVRNNPGMVPDTWYLIYEEPGESALSKELRFDSASACAVDAPASPCDPEKLEQGTRVRVEGWEMTDSVLVRTIQSPELLVDVPATATSPATGTPSTGTPATGTPSAGTSTGTSTATSTVGTSTLVVRLYYYNPDRDQGPGGVQCSRAGLVPVERIIPRTDTSPQDTIRLLLRGEISSTERARGIMTEFPLSGVTLEGASNKKGTLTLTFKDMQSRTSGGSCRVAILWHQIEATAKQFPGVETVRFKPDDLFQP